MRTTEQAVRLLAGCDIRMPGGVILGRKIPLTPTDTILDHGYNVINVQFKPVTGRKTVFVADGAHPGLEGDPASRPIHCVCHCVGC